jgi:hypothetical protein
MDWNELASAIARMSPRQRRRSVVFIEAYDEPQRRAFEIEAVTAHEGVYCGLGIGSNLVVPEGEPFLREKQGR